MKCKRVLFDQDDVLADFHQGFVNAWKAKNYSLPAVEVNALKHFSVVDNYPEEWHQQVHDIYCAPGFFRTLPPIEEALAALRAIMGMGHEVWICTSPMQRYRHCVQEKYEWVEQHLGLEFTNRIILTRDKTLIKGDLLLDDNPHIVGYAKPEWMQVMVDRPYNRNVKGLRINWQSWEQSFKSMLSD
jgi:5'-nucleotidase